MIPLLVKIGLVLAVVVLIGVVFARARTATTRGTTRPARMPRSLALIGAVLALAGLFLASMSFTVDEDPGAPGSLLPLRIASVAMFAGGGILLLLGSAIAFRKRSPRRPDPGEAR